MGTWSFGYDNLNRLTTATSGTNAPAPYASNYGCWTYDDFGNRKSEAMSTTACTGSPTPMSVASYTTTNTNRMDSTTMNPNQRYDYDAAGDITNDGRNLYLYDAEGHICAVSFTVYGTTIMTGYIYDSGGTRVAKGTIANWGSCDPTINGFQTSNETDYVLGPSGEQATEVAMDSNNAMTWAHTNAWADGKMLATYDANGLHFHLTNPLGTRRVQTSSSGMPELDCESLPFGDQQNCFPDPNAPATADDATPLHFTGKERDSESGNDYFGARYYASSMGRWMSPDDSLDGAIMELPQTWNKYSYEYNRPLYGTDPDGRCPPCIGAVIGGVVEGGFNLGKQFVNNGYSFKGTNWQEVGANAAGGAVAGAIAGATGGASLVLDAAAGATGNIVGGIVTRGLDPNTSSDDVLSAGAVSQDALSGFVGGGAGHVAGEFVHIPDEPHFSMSGRNGRIYNQAYRQGLRDVNARNTQAFVNQGVRAGVTSSTTSHTSNGIQDWLTRWWFNQASQPEPQPHVTHRICDENGNNCQ